MNQQERRQYDLDMAEELRRISDLIKAGKVEILESDEEAGLLRVPIVGESPVYRTSGLFTITITYRILN
jgi:hypothetical protein